MRDPLRRGKPQKNARTPNWEETTLVAFPGPWWSDREQTGSYQHRLAHLTRPDFIPPQNERAVYHEACNFQ
jgi:hypothetical protein